MATEEFNIIKTFNGINYRVVTPASEKFLTKKERAQIEELKTLNLDRDEYKFGVLKAIARMNAIGFGMLPPEFISQLMASDSPVAWAYEI